VTLRFVYPGALDIVKPIYRRLGASEKVAKGPDLTIHVKEEILRKCRMSASVKPQKKKGMKK
jgi:hypothetical protein